jgi:hypothetical protein
LEIEKVEIGKEAESQGSEVGSQKKLKWGKQKLEKKPKVRGQRSEDGKRKAKS